MFHGDTLYAETKVLEVKESSSKPDRGIVTVETRGYNQDGVEVLYFRRKVMVPKRGTVEEQPGRPAPREAG
jgi:acyl dehydratase